MSKYCKVEDVIRWINAELKFQDIPKIEVSEGVIGQGSGDIDWQAVTSTGQEIYAKGYEDGRKSVEVSEDCIDRYSALAELDPRSYEYKAIKELPSVVRASGCRLLKRLKWANHI